MSKLASLIKMAGRNPESKAAAIATAATTGITIAKYFFYLSIYGAIAGVGVSLIAKKLMEKQAGKTQAQDDIIEHAPLQPDPNAPKRGE